MTIGDRQQLNDAIGINYWLIEPTTPRRSRVILPNVPQHIIQRGNNRKACFYADDDYQIYLQWLKEYADKTEYNIHA